MRLADAATTGNPPVTAAATPGVDSAARIGPNAIIQLRRALDSRHGDAATRALFDQCGLSQYLETPPESMVDERQVIQLHRRGRQLMGADNFAETARLAGKLTGDYILTNRIPRPAHLLLPLLPRRLAMRILLGAMARHAWTFAGSGRFGYRLLPGGAVLHIDDSPLARNEVSAAPVCDYYASTFERIFQTLIDPAIEVSETGCIAAGAQRCRFVASSRRAAQH